MISDQVLSQRPQTRTDCYLDVSDTILGCISRGTSVRHRHPENWHHHGTFVNLGESARKLIFLSVPQFFGASRKSETGSDEGRTCKWKLTNLIRTGIVPLSHSPLRGQILRKGFRTLSRKLWGRPPKGYPYKCPEIHWYDSRETSNCRREEK